VNDLDNTVVAIMSTACNKGLHAQHKTAAFIVDGILLRHAVNLSTIKGMSQLPRWSEVVSYLMIRC